MCTSSIYRTLIRQGLDSGLTWGEAEGEPINASGSSATAHRDHPGNIVLTIIIVPSRFEFWKFRFSTFLPGSTSASARPFPDLAPPARRLSPSLALASLSEGSVGF